MSSSASFLMPAKALRNSFLGLWVFIFSLKGGPFGDLRKVKFRYRSMKTKVSRQPRELRRAGSSRVLPFSQSSRADYFWATSPLRRRTARLDRCERRRREALIGVAL